MSEQAKIASLQEKIKEERNSARTMGILSVFSIIIMFLGFGLYLGLSQGLGALFMGIMGIVGTVLFSIGEWGANMRKNQLMKELDNLGKKIPTCPKCGKQIPQGNFEFCPFCGTALGRK